MKKLIVLLIVTAIIVIACNKKAVPVITERRTPPTQPITDPSLLSVIPDTLIGKIVFINRCGRCHGLPEPNQFTSKRWDGILSYMIPRARLTDEQGIHITAYLKANAAP